MKYLTITRKMLIKITATVVAVVAVFAVVLATPNAEQTSAGKKLLPIYSVGRTDKRISISFDAAWGNEDTQVLIDTLKKYNVHTTFFVVGEWVDKYPESVKALSDAGHEVMNHSSTHPHMPTLTREQMVSEIATCNDKIEKITGRRPILFRAPYGDYDNTMIETVQGLGMYTVQWDVDSLDWKDYTADKITSRVTSRVQSGSIVLFHNAAKHTPEALSGIIEKLQSDGYEIVPVSELIYKENYSINIAGKQLQKAETMGNVK